MQLHLHLMLRRLGGGPRAKTLARLADTPASCLSTVATRRRQDHCGYTRSEIFTFISAQNIADTPAQRYSPSSLLLGCHPRREQLPPAQKLIRHKPKGGTCRPQGVQARLEAQVPRANKTRSETAEKIQLTAPASLLLPAAAGGSNYVLNIMRYLSSPRRPHGPLKHRYLEPSRAQRMQ